VTEHAFEDRLQDEAGEDDQGQADEACDPEPLAPEAPPDEGAASDRLVKRCAAAIERQRCGISGAAAQTPTIES
jgi:hypothetical protein